MSQWNWDNASIAVEHCDRYIPEQSHEKGFLSLEDEIWAISNSDFKINSIGITINWARSAIEGRSAKTPLMHIKICQESNVPLLGLMFSGCCSKEDPVYGHPWEDVHTPFAISYNAQNTLMTTAHVKECLQTCKELLYVGIKIAPRSSTSTPLSLAERMSFIQDGIKVLNTYLEKQDS